MRTKALFLILISGLAIQVACGTKEESSPGLSQKPVPIAAITSKYLAVPAIVQTPGTVQPRNRIPLASQINGFVREMRVRVGDSVKTDQVLAVLDARDAESQTAASQSALEEAQAALAEARRAYQAAVDMQSAAKTSMELASQTLGRYQKLSESRSISPQELDEVRARRNASVAELAARESMTAAAQERIKQVEARISQAKAQMGRAAVLMSWTQIKSPSAGKVVERAVDPGAAIFPGTPIAVIESSANPQVLSDLPTEYAGSLWVGMEVRIRSTDTAAPIGGRVTEIVPLSNPATHSIQFKVDLASHQQLTNGQFVRVDVPVGSRDALLIPRSAVRETGQLTGVFVADTGSRARFRLVKTAPYDAEQLEILSGLEPGENVVAVLNDQITDGTPVEIRP
jgi:multidrug efflux pump subunit AcrA (membrane-fusion protein)